MHWVLVVDDHAANSAPLVKLLKFSGIDAQSASSGPEALATMRVRRPDVVLLDVMMPQMDGFDVLRHIRAEPGYDAVAVLMYTAVAEIETHARALRLGAQGYIVKGTSFDELRAEVQQYLPGR